MMGIIYETGYQMLEMLARSIERVCGSFDCLEDLIVSWSVLYLDRPCALKSLHAWTISLCLSQVVYFW